MGALADEQRAARRARARERARDLRDGEGAVVIDALMEAEIVATLAPTMGQRVVDDYFDRVTDRARIERVNETRDRVIGERAAYVADLRARRDAAWAADRARRDALVPRNPDLVPARGDERVYSLRQNARRPG